MKKRISGVSVALLAAGALAAPATAAWTSPINLSAAGQNALEQQVAVAADGDAVFVWKRSDGADARIQTRTRSSVGVLGATQTLSASGEAGSNPQVAVDDDGDAVFTWYRFDGTSFRVQARARSAAGVLSPVLNVSPAGQNGFDPQIAVDSDGDAVITWRGFDGTNSRVQARARSAAGVLSPVQNVSPAGQNASAPQLDVDASGDAVLTWVRPDGSHSRVQARARSAAGVLSPVQTLSADGQNAATAEVAVDATNDAVVTWSRPDGSNTRVQARARSAAGVLSPIQNVSSAGQNAAKPEVAVDVGGDAVLTWELGAFGSPVQARGRSAAGVLSVVQNVSAAGSTATVPQVATDNSGDAVLTWLRSDGSFNRVQARTRSGAGVLGAVTTLSAGGQAAQAPQVGIDADGDAAVTWQRSDGVNSRVQAAASP